MAIEEYPKVACLSICSQTETIQNHNLIQGQYLEPIELNASFEFFQNRVRIILGQIRRRERERVMLNQTIRSGEERGIRLRRNDFIMRLRETERERTT